MPLFDQLRGFLAEVQGEKKAAAQKKADTLSEPGSIGGATSHPVKNVDDQLQTATEGARSSENSSDVKKQIPLAVDSASEKGPDQESQQFNIGVTSTETGNDSANEENYKDKKDDPGTTHPADVSDNEKYGSMSFDQLKKLSEKKANDILATIAAAGQKAASQKSAAPARPTPAAPAKAPAAANPAPAQKAAATQAAAAGYQAATDAAAAGDEQEKVAVQAAVEGTIRDALSAAVMTGNYLLEFKKQAAKKQAADDEDSSSSSSDSESGSKSEGGESKSKSDSGGGDSGGGGGGEGGGGGAPPDAGGGGGGGLGLDPAALGAMAGGGAGGGGDPMAGGGGQEDAVNQLLMALMEMGVSPDEIMAALQGAGGGGGDPMAGGGDPMAGLGGGGGDPMAGLGGGGGDPMAGGDPLAAAGGGGDPMKMARIKQARQAQTVRRNLMQLVKSAKTYQRQGKFRFSEAKTAAERRLRDELKKCIAEIVN